MSKIDFAPGGQAVIEGVLMRSPTHIAVAVRNPKGEIVFERKPFTSLTQRVKILSLPFIRGIVGIGEMMVIGFRALNFSANIFAETSEIGAKMQQEKAAPTDSTPAQKSGALEQVFFVLAIAVSLGMSLFFFKFLPLAVATFFSNHIEFVKNNFIIFNLIDGVTKMGIFVGYIGLLLLTKDMRRVFQYHGAEHKAVYTYEKGLDLTVENARQQSRLHPRCGTSFIMLVILLSVATYTILPRGDGFLQNFFLRVAWLPIIGGLSYELLKLSAKNMDRAWVKVMVTPGLWMQKMTTQEPDDQQVEVALKALEKSLP